MLTAQHPKPRRETVDDTIHRLEKYMSRFERRYECPTEVMAKAVRCGLVKETAEISRWLTSYWVLRGLEDRAGNGGTTGTRTKTT